MTGFLSEGQWDERSRSCIRTVLSLFRKSIKARTIYPIMEDGACVDHPRAHAHPYTQTHKVDGKSNESRPNDGPTRLES